MVELPVLAFFKVDPLFHFRSKLCTVRGDENLPLIRRTNLSKPVFRRQINNDLFALFEQLRMGTSTDEHNHSRLPDMIELVDKQPPPTWHSR